MANSKITMGDVQNGLVKYILTNMHPPLVKRDWDRAVNYFENVCAYCGREDPELQRDHVIPINKDNLGEHVKGNIVPACKECNNTKSNKSYVEYLTNRPEVREQIEEFMRSERYYPLKGNKEIETILKNGREAVKNITLDCMMRIKAITDDEANYS